jgi:hypothetical protein
MLIQAKNFGSADKASAAGFGALRHFRRGRTPLLRKRGKWCTVRALTWRGELWRGGSVGLVAELSRGRFLHAKTAIRRMASEGWEF